jgi:hypothetical protein
MADSTGPISVDPEILQWQNRILVVCAAGSEDSAYVAQLGMLATVQGRMRERDLVTFHLTADTSSFEGRQLSAESREETIERFEIPLDRFEVILIGKDGTIKLRRSEPTTAAEIFELIDSMPMRQREMREE